MFDGISICLSKGLGAPVGSILLGNRETINKAKRVRKVLGGGWRQAGYLAAAGIYALDNHIDRLKDDHRHAQAIGQVLIEQSYVKSLMPVDTNIIIFELEDDFDADEFVETLKGHGIRCNTFGHQMIRFVTHLDVTPQMVDQTLSILKKVG